MMNNELKCTFRKIIRCQQSPVIGVMEIYENYATCYMEECTAFFEGKCIRLSEHFSIEQEKKEAKDILHKPVEILNLSKFTLRKLRYCMDVRTIGDLLQKTKIEISRTKNIGQRTFNEIIEALAKHGFVLEKGSYY